MNNITFSKQYLKAVFIFTILAIPALSFSQHTTEEYAVISVYQRGKKNFMSVQIGSKATQDKEFEMEKEDKRYDIAPVIEEMDKLNAQGFEVISFSNAIVPASQYGGGFPFYTILMRKKI